MNQAEQIQKRASTTYYFATKFFPKKVRQDVFDLYAFVRVVDDFVDEQPQDEAGFKKFYKEYKKQLKKFEPNTEYQEQDKQIIHNFLRLADKYDFDPAWTEAFFDSMRMDLSKKLYETLDETLDYIYGSAEVIGLYMARIMGNPDSLHEAAMMQGRAMQMINFIRDIAEDINDLGRQYIPQQLLDKHGLPSLIGHDDYKFYLFKNDLIPNFEDMMREVVEIYFGYQKEAEAAYKHFAHKRYAVPVKTASDMYNWTAKRIYERPMQVWEGKIKPNKQRVVRSAIGNYIRVYSGIY